MLTYLIRKNKKKKRQSWNIPVRGVHQPNESDNSIQTVPTQFEKSNPKLLDWVMGFVYINPKFLDWVMDCRSHNPNNLIREINN